MANNSSTVAIPAGGRYGAGHVHAIEGFVPRGTTSMFVVGEALQVQEWYRQDNSDIWSVDDATTELAVGQLARNTQRYGINALFRPRPRNRLDLFFRNPEQGVQHSWRHEDRDDYQTESLGGEFAEHFSVVAEDPSNSKSRLDVFALGVSDLQVYHRWFDGSDWTVEWTSLGMAGNYSGNAGAHKGPIAVSSRPGRIDVFMRAPHTGGGPQSSIYHRFFDDGIWHPFVGGWNDLSGYSLYPVGAVSPSPGHVMIATGSVGVEECMTRLLTPDGWGEWERHGKYTSFELLAWEGNITIVSFGYAGNHLQLYEKTWRDGVWGPWKEIAIPPPVAVNEPWRLNGVVWNPIERKRYFYVWNDRWFVEVGELNS